jgi:hypothetical protein
MATVEYNEVVIHRPQVQRVAVAPSYDEENRLAQYWVLTFECTGWLYQLDGSNEHDTSVGAKRVNIAQAVASLNIPRKNFFWRERLTDAESAILRVIPTSGGAVRQYSSVGTPGVGSQAENFLNAFGQDVWWGPKTRAELVFNSPGIAQVKFTLEAHLSPTLMTGMAQSEPRSGSQLGTEIISHTSTVTYTIDQNHYTTRVTEGRIRYRADIRTDADALRSDVFIGGAFQGIFGGTTTGTFTKGIPLPASFVRQQAVYRIGPERNALSYIVIDREVYRTPPIPSTTIEAQLEVKATGFNVLSFEKRLVGVVQGNRLTTKAELLSVVLRLIERHIMTVPLVFVEEARLIDFLYENRVAFIFEAIQAPGLLYSTFKEAGIFIEPPTEGEHFAQDIRGTAGLEGSGYNLTPGRNDFYTQFVPYSVGEAFSETSKELESEAYEQLIKEGREKGVLTEPGLVHQDEKVILRYVRSGQSHRKTNKIDPDGVSEDTSTTSAEDYLGDLYIAVCGVKVGMVNPGTGLPPAAPNPVKLWNDSDEARSILSGQTLTDTLKMTGRVVRNSPESVIKLRSKLAGQDLYSIEWKYIVRLEPLLVQKLLLNLALDKTTILEGVEWPEANDGFREQFIQMVQTSQWNPSKQRTTGAK